MLTSIVAFRLAFSVFMILYGTARPNSQDWTVGRPDKILAMPEHDPIKTKDVELRL